MEDNDAVVMVVLIIAITLISIICGLTHMSFEMNKFYVEKGYTRTTVDGWTDWVKK